MRCFLLQPVKQGIDISSVDEYGEVVTLFPNHGMRASIWSEQFQKDIRAQLLSHSFCPQDDAIIIAGTMVPIVLFVTTVIEQYSTCTFLLFSATERRYISRRVGESLNETRTCETIQKNSTTLSRLTRNTRNS